MPIDIFSKKTGGYEVDARVKKTISDNAPTIKRLADQISNGGYSEMQRRKSQKPPEAKGLIIHDLGHGVGSDDPQPYIKVSVNGRVVLADLNSGKQIQVLGELRQSFPNRYFVLASKDNGFFSPLDEQLHVVLKDLDGTELSPDFSEDDLVAKLQEVLELE